MSGVNEAFLLLFGFVPHGVYGTPQIKLPTKSSLQTYARTTNARSLDIQKNSMKSDKLLVPADKTSNFYKMDTQSYNDLLQKNITKTYKKATPDTADSIELKAKDIAKKLQLDGRINTTAKREAFITLKDHKPNFANNPTCRLINPAKSEIGKISKQLLDRINTTLVSKLRLNQWKNTKAVLVWFTGIQHK